MMNPVATNTSVPHTEYFPQPRSQSGPGRWLAVVLDDVEQLTRFWPVVQNMVSQELRVRYQRSVLGFFWTLLNPILMMTTLALVFSQVFHLEDTGNYAVYLFAGMVPWGFLSASISDCAYCIIWNEGLIRKIYLPKLIFPLTRVLISLTTFVFSLAALFVLVGPLGAKPSWSLVLLPIVIAQFAIFTMGLGLIVATANTFFRDCGHLVSVFLQAWYFATPIIYEVTRLAPAARVRFWLNPAYPFIRMFQTIIRDGLWPDLTTFVAASVIAAVSLGIGYVAFKSNENKLVFRL